MKTFRQVTAHANAIIRKSNHHDTTEALIAQYCLDTLWSGHTVAQLIGKLQWFRGQDRGAEVRDAVDKMLDYISPKPAQKKGA